MLKSIQFDQELVELLGGVNQHPALPPPAPLYLHQFLVKLDTLLHRIGLQYVNGFRVIVGQVLRLVMDRLEGLDPPPCPLADPPLPVLIRSQYLANDNANSIYIW